MDNGSTLPQTEAMHALAQAVQHAGELLAAALAPVREAVQAAWGTITEFIDSVMDACRKIYDWAYDQYLTSGAIYGSSHEGMMRWWEERLRIARLRQAATYLEQRHRMLAEIRGMRR